MTSTVYLALIQTRAAFLNQMLDALQYPDIEALMASDDPDTAFRSQLLVVEANIRKLSRSITQIDDTHAAWIAAIQQLRPAERTGEADSYRDATTTSDSFLFVLERAHNALDDLHTAKLNLELRIGRSTSPAGSVPSGSVPVNTNDQSGSVPVNTNDQSRSVPVNTNDRIPMQPNNHLINLPKLQIAKFDGDYRRWPQFWATFEHAIDTQPITDVEKVAYLLSYLEGRALEAVAGYTVAPEHYESIKQTLREKFGRPQTLLKELYAELQEMPSSKKDNRDLAEYVTNIERV
ncbi:unnamed protein product, partial [Anisakis simplex]|uniref:Retrotransposon gag domain-containing protein n=1 Tax=Anisakis simplex TaxID=6269 RepID=A0A0M3JBX8_ANISI